jgi:hypothetical protein
MLTPGRVDEVIETMLWLLWPTQAHDFDRVEKRLMPFTTVKAKAIVLRVILAVGAGCSAAWPFPGVEKSHSPTRRPSRRDAQVTANPVFSVTRHCRTLWAFVNLV